MPNNAPTVVVISVLIAVNAAVGNVASHDSADRCVERIDERTSAYVTRDWQRLEVLARQYIVRCSGVVDIENVSDAYEDVVRAEFELKHFTAALQASDRCLNKWYSNAGCHVLRLQSLLALNRLNTARTELERSKKLVDHAIERASSGKPTINDPTQHEKNEATLNKLRALQELLAELERSALLDGSSLR
jgi:hypothetical protein